MSCTSVYSWTNAWCASFSKKDCEYVAEKLIKTLGFENTPKAKTISFYHAGLEAEDRAFRHHEWSKGKIKLIVATIAFGMGINKPDVRYVIHHTIPQSVTHYYQVWFTEHCHLRFLWIDVVGSRSRWSWWWSGTLYSVLFLYGYSKKIDRKLAWNLHFCILVASKKAHHKRSK